MTQTKYIYCFGNLFINKICEDKKIYDNLSKINQNRFPIYEVD